VDALAGAADLVLVEADGARRRSLKAPADHEPVVPRSASLVGRARRPRRPGHAVSGPLVHRPELVARLTGASSVTEEALAACLAHPRSYPRLRAPGRRLAVFLNKAEDEGGRGGGAADRPRLCPPYDLVVAGSARGTSERLR
jgi:molybdenum cofactor cytidylyltransferase